MEEKVKRCMATFTGGASALEMYSAQLAFGWIRLDFYFIILYIVCSLPPESVRQVLYGPIFTLILHFWLDLSVNLWLEIP